jgi:hypothetical protein
VESFTGRGSWEGKELNLTFPEPNPAGMQCVGAMADRRGTHSQSLTGPFMPHVVGHDFQDLQVSVVTLVILNSEGALPQLPSFMRLSCFSSNLLICLLLSLSPAF